METFDASTTLERSLIHSASQNRFPINGSLELLPLCNMNCDMCYVRLSREEMERRGRIRTAEEWIEIARQMQKAGTLFLLLTGGEPFLYPEFKKLYLELRKLGMIITINTNGTMIDEKMASFLGENKPRRVNITLYGADEDAYTNLCHYPGGFAKVVRGVRLLKEQKIDVKLSSSLTPENKDDVERMLEIGRELDVPVRMDTYMMPAIRERNKPYDQQSRLDSITAAKVRIESLKGEMETDLFDQFMETTLQEVNKNVINKKKSRHMSCLAGKCSYTINWQGEMRPCVVLNQPAISVFEVGFEGAWKYIIKETDKILLNEKCSTCRMRSLCRTCAACALLEEGSYDAVPKYMCQYTETSLHILESIAKKKNKL